LLLAVAAVLVFTMVLPAAVALEVLELLLVFLY
jgi:hypothetical protein